MSIAFNSSKHKVQILDSSDKIKRIRCRIRKIQVLATPEEKVRQTLLNYLIDEKKFPPMAIEVEKSFAHFQDGVLDRADIIVFNDDNEPIIIYECKKPHHGLTDEFILQGLRYLAHIPECPYVGYVSGSEIAIFKQNGLSIENLQEIKGHPSYIELCNYTVNYESYRENYSEHYDWSYPVDIDVLDDFYYYGYMGKKTLDIYHSFLVNFKNWLLNYQDEIPEQESFKDIGRVYTKFGNAGGGDYLGQYRAILSKSRLDKPVFCLGLTSSGTEKSGYGTLIYMGIKSPKARHSCLQLRINSSVSLSDDYASIYHSGSMTVGKLGAMKRKEIIDYVRNNSKDLVRDNKICLGTFDTSKDILSNQEQTIDFVRRITEYGLLREELRGLKKERAAG